LKIALLLGARDQLCPSQSESVDANFSKLPFHWIKARNLGRKQAEKFRNSNEELLSIQGSMRDLPFGSQLRFGTLE